MMTCRELTRLIAGGRLPFESWKRRLAVRLHLLLCRHCRNYSMQLGAIDDEARRRWPAAAEDRSLSSLEGRIVRTALRNASPTAASRREGRE